MYSTRPSAATSLQGIVACIGVGRAMASSSFFSRAWSASVVDVDVDVGVDWAYASWLELYNSCYCRHGQARQFRSRNPGLGRDGR
jgi:hypothetical protein